METVVTWSTLILAAALGAASADAGDLALTNARFTRGILGPPRHDAKLLPGDNLYLSFDIEGITIADDGKVLYSTGIEVLDPSGKSIFKQDPRKAQAIASLGGNRVPGFATVDVGLSQPPGEYTMEVTVIDEASGKKASLKKTFEVREKAFGLVRLAATSDPEGLLPVPTPGAGQGIWLHFGVVGFERDATSGQPNVKVSLRILEDGKPTLARPFAGAIEKNVPKTSVLLPVQFPVLLNRPGTFTTELTAEDTISGKTDKFSCTFTVTGK
jgi:hypothetical protein